MRGTLCKLIGRGFSTGKEGLVSSPQQITLKLALAGCCEIRLLAEPQTATSEVNHNFAIIPRAIQKYFVTLVVGSFWNVILNLKKRETSKCRLSTAALLDALTQLHSTISYCSDMCPAVINRHKAWTWNAPFEGQVLSWWMQTAVPFSDINIIFCFTD